jgi:hypothetical protein
LLAVKPGVEKGYRNLWTPKIRVQSMFIIIEVAWRQCSISLSSPVLLNQIFVLFRLLMELKQMPDAQLKLFGKLLRYIF